MSEYTVRYINCRAESDAAAFIHDCEEHYHRQIHMAADEIMRDHVRRPIVLINGPSSSGKTTTNDRIARIVELAGVHAEMLSMDDYYRTATEYDQPMDDENGVPDLESPECMDLERLSSDLKRLAAGEEVSVPRFDFETRTSIPHDRTLQLGKDEVIMIEGIHSFNPVIMGDLAHRATSIYLSVARGRGLSRICCAFCAAPCATACSAHRRSRRPCVSGTRCAAASACISRPTADRQTSPSTPSCRTR